ncbi:rano class II histocompatibility antigen, B alpha chain-like isoform X2 [Protopterus annectens]|uniref:rano class II histocompatibility antigen, B alpha chain-like isoform X2 n=1 Tax=Protopterus annectens TaxID=7888 RepID=UPI001CF93709|nr:rano class II histocompatibility antigen, B alpha chain-like isoform X2 [Protopterus annectens]
MATFQGFGLLLGLLFWINISDATFRFRKLEILPFTVVDMTNIQMQSLVILVNGVPAGVFDQHENNFLVRLNVSEEACNKMKQSAALYIWDAKGSMEWQKVLIRMMENKQKMQPPVEPPSINIYSEKPYVPGQNNTIYCYATGFYPPKIDIMFFENGNHFTGKVYASDISFSEDWRFKIMKFIHVVPQQTTLYSCKVNHISLKQPRELILGCLPSSEMGVSSKNSSADRGSRISSRMSPEGLLNRSHSTI